MQVLVPGPGGIASLPGCSPCCARSPVLQGETSLGGGQQQSDSGSTAGEEGGGGWVGGKLGSGGRCGRVGGGITQKSLGLAYPDLGQPESAGGGQIITPCWLLPQI